MVNIIGFVRKYTLGEMIRRLYYEYAMPKDIIVRTKLKTGLKMVLPSWDRGLSKDVYTSKIREENALEFFMNHITKEDRIIDCGANMGFYVVHEGLAEYIYAVEPVKDSCVFIELNCMINNIRNCKTYDQAIGKINGTIDFYESEYYNLSGTTEREIKGWDVKYNKIKVKMNKLDTFIKENNIKANVLRMDTEGCELEILRSGKKFLKQKNCTIFMEVHKMFIKTKGVKEICDILIDAGFKTCQICDDEKKSSKMKFKEYNLNELKLMADIQKEVFHMWTTKVVE